MRRHRPRASPRRSTLRPYLVGRVSVLTQLPPTQKSPPYDASGSAPQQIQPAIADSERVEGADSGFESRLPLRKYPRRRERRLHVGAATFARHGMRKEENDGQGN